MIAFLLLAVSGFHWKIFHDLITDKDIPVLIRERDGRAICRIYTTDTLFEPSCGMDDIHIYSHLGLYETMGQARKAAEAWSREKGK